jgi:2-aminoadipate transaminase
MPQILALSARDEYISFAVGLPPTELLPAPALSAAFARALADPTALQLSPPLPALKEHVVELMRMRGLRCTADEVLITTGAQQALDLIARALVPRGGHVVTDPVAFPGFYKALEPLDANLHPIGQGGQLYPAVLAAELGAGLQPNLIYTSADGHNPTGAEMPLLARRLLVQLARHHHIPILEDDAYGLLRLEDEAIPPLAALDRDIVFYVGSLSKALAPALRVGWVVAPAAAIAKLAIAKDLADINCANVVHRALSSYFEQGDFSVHLDAVRAEFRARRDAMLDGIGRYFPAGVRASSPRTGIFLWVTLPHGCDAGDLLERAIREEQVLFVPGAIFAARPCGEATRCFRLCFTSCSNMLMEEGLSRLGAVLARYLTDVRRAARVTRKRRTG